MNKHLVHTLTANRGYSITTNEMLVKQCVCAKIMSHTFSVATIKPVGRQQVDEGLVEDTLFWFSVNRCR